VSITPSPDRSTAPSRRASVSNGNRRPSRGSPDTLPEPVDHLPDVVIDNKFRSRHRIGRVYCKGEHRASDPSCQILRILFASYTELRTGLIRREPMSSCEGYRTGVSGATAADRFCRIGSANANRLRPPASAATPAGSSGSVGSGGLARGACIERRCGGGGDAGIPDGTPYRLPLERPSYATARCGGTASTPPPSTANQRRL
jgi:hypothetical protein